MFKGLFGGQPAEQPTTLGVLDRLEALQSRLVRMKAALVDQRQTQFLVVTIPTSLAVAESKRLVESLQNENINIAAIVCNQIVSESAGLPYLLTRRRGQQNCLSQLKTVADANKIQITEVPYIDTEVTGVFGLRFFASIAHPPKAKSATNPIDSRKLTVFGGKGGVGKTTSAASWAVQLADAGLKVLVVSTDPAHSLGDAFQEKLSGIPRMLDQSYSGGQLWAMEIDPTSALEEFKDVVQGALGAPAEESAGMGIPDIKGELFDLVSGVNDPPPGTDEIVAMAKVVSYLEDGYEVNGQRIRFDRIVLDTAPTGHTLRMLSLPTFLKGLMQKLRKIRDKTGSFSNFLGMGSTSTVQGSETQESQGRLEKFEGRMDRLQSLLHNPKDTEFAVVTIATDLATAETKRLLLSLADEKILVRRLIVNQLISEQSDADNGAASSAYLSRLRQGQKNSLSELGVLAAAADVPLMQVPYFDYEVRTVYGLRAISSVLLP